MMTILNRLRGTQGLWSKINGLLLAFTVLAIWGNVWVAIAVGLGYIIGESFGWGEWVGTVSCYQDKAFVVTNSEEGQNNGIMWFASKLIDPAKDWLNYCRVALTIRGFYWFAPTLAPLYFVGFNPIALGLAIVMLSIGFPIACEIGYLLKDKVHFEKYGFSVVGGWEIQEIAYGLIQDLVIIGLVGAYYYGI